MILDLFYKKIQCTHPNFSADREWGYCPDCGEFVENEWFLTRCGCCGIKEKAIIKNGEITCQSHFCKNCGGKDFIVEKLRKINFIDINYAVLVKSVRKNLTKEFTQSWIEPQTCTNRLRQLPQFR